MLWLWKAWCVAKEQGWDLAWVWAQMGKNTAIHVAGPRSKSGEPSGSTIVVVPHVGRGKRKAVPAPGPTKRVRRRASLVAGPSGLRIFLPRSGCPLLLAVALQVCLEESQTVVARLHLENKDLQRERNRGCVQAQAQEEELHQARRKQDDAVCAWDLSLCKCGGLLEGREVGVGGLVTQLAQVMGLERVAGITVPLAAEVNELAWGLREVNALEGRQYEWLLWEVAGAQDKALSTYPRVCYAGR
ncbi:hypothetical protein C0992_001264 [Termitomyces sp. T32_za158]|nr:hypothetical protein C0992_001264 [Termitomyces sp. T32_za158]